MTTPQTISRRGFLQLGASLGMLLGLGRFDWAQAATASDPSERPVLLWVDRDAGHGQGKPLNLRLRDVVDQRIFLMSQLGLPID